MTPLALATSVDIAPWLETKLVIPKGPLAPKPKIPLSPPYPDAPTAPLAVPTPVVSVATTPWFETLLDIFLLPPLSIPKANTPLSPP